MPFASVVSRVISFPASSRQDHGHVRAPGLERAGLGPVAVRVDEHRVTDRAGAVGADIDVVDGLADGETHRHRVRRGRGRRGGQRGLVDVDGVVAGVDVAEGVAAVGVRRDGGDDVAAVVDEVDAHATQPRLVGVLGLARIDVVPDRAVDGTLIVGAEVDRVVVAADAEGGGDIVRRRQREAGGQGGLVDLDRVVAGEQVVEAVRAVGRRDRVDDDAALQQVDGDRPVGRQCYEVRFGRVLDPVVVGVDPDAVADRAVVVDADIVAGRGPADREADRPGARDDAVVGGQRSGVDIDRCSRLPARS